MKAKQILIVLLCAVGCLTACKDKREQIQLDGDWEKEYRDRYPALSDWTFFSIDCRPNHELYDRFASYGRNVILLEPLPMRHHLEGILRAAADNYGLLPEA